MGKISIFSKWWHLSWFIPLKESTNYIIYVAITAFFRYSEDSFKPSLPHQARDDPREDHSATICHQASLAGLVRTLLPGLRNIAGTTGQAGQGRGMENTYQII